LRELGAEPPMTDLIFWYWKGRPGPDWTGESSAIAFEPTS
jgi:hypothetical protein